MVSSVNDKLNNFRKAWSCVLAFSASRIFNSPDAPLFIKFHSETLLRLSFLLAWNSHHSLMRSLRASLPHLTILAYASATIAFQRRCFADFPLPCWGRLSRPLFLSFYWHGDLFVASLWTHCRNLLSLRVCWAYYLVQLYCDTGFSVSGTYTWCRVLYCAL